MTLESESEYGSYARVASALGPKLETLIRDLLATIGLTVHDVVHRVKAHDSALKKLSSNPERYGSFADMHDLLGVRVITYFASDVEKVVALLRDNFDVDDDRSLDKQNSLDPDRFGYLSHHLVARTHFGRRSLAEWAPYNEVFFEVQIRSILQHTWAEIEHDLGYKSESAIPVHIRRRFARLAGLLEIADSEFDAISNAVASHVEHVETVIAKGDRSVLAIDRDSILALVASRGVVTRADKAIARGAGARLEFRMSRRYAGARAANLISAGFTTIQQVEEALTAEEDQIVQFAVGWFMTPVPIGPDDPPSPGRGPDGHYETLSPGISLFYLYLHKKLQSAGGFDELSHIDSLNRPEVQAVFRDIHDRAFGDAL